jgi:hypothetical protein
MVTGKAHLRTIISPRNKNEETSNCLRHGFNSAKDRSSGHLKQQKRQTKAECSRQHRSTNYGHTNGVHKLQAEQTQQHQQKVILPKWMQFTKSRSKPIEMTTDIN